MRERGCLQPVIPYIWVAANAFIEYTSGVVFVLSSVEVFMVSPHGVRCTRFHGILFVAEWESGCAELACEEWG